MFEAAQFDDAVTTLRPGERFWLYSDGLSEATNPNGEMFGMNRLGAELHALSATPHAEGVKTLWQRVKSWTDGESPQDDVSVVALEIGGS